MKRRFLRIKRNLSNKGMFVPLIIFLLFSTVIMFYYGNIKIPRELEKHETKIRAELDIDAMPVVLMAVVRDSKGISKYTKLTEELINERIEFIEIPEKFALHNGINNKVDLLNKVTMEDLRENEQINIYSLSDEEDWFGRYDRVKEYIVKTIVAEEVQEGNLVDVIVHYGDGDYDVVLSKTKVRKLIKGNANGTEVGERENSLFKNNEYMVNFAVDEIDYRDLKAAEKLAQLIGDKHETKGYFELRLYIDNDQPASLKTFDYDIKYKKLIGLLNEKETTNKKILEYIEEDRKLQEKIKTNPTEELINEYYFENTQDKKETNVKNEDTNEDNIFDVQD